MLPIKEMDHKTNLKGLKVGKAIQPSNTINALVMQGHDSRVEAAIQIEHQSNQASRGSIVSATATTTVDRPQGLSAGFVHEHSQYSKPGVPASPAVTELQSSFTDAAEGCVILSGRTTLNKESIPGLRIEDSTPANSARSSRIKDSTPANLFGCSSFLHDILIAQGFDTIESISNLEFEDLSDILPEDVTPIIRDELSSVWLDTVVKEQRKLRDIAKHGLPEPATNKVFPPIGKQEG